MEVNPLTIKQALTIFYFFSLIFDTLVALRVSDFLTYWIKKILFQTMTIRLPDTVELVIKIFVFLASLWLEPSILLLYLVAILISNF